jgi:Protein of unknown function (DUF3305)
MHFPQRFTNEPHRMNTPTDCDTASQIPAKVLWSVDVSFYKRALQSRWADYAWEPLAVAFSERAQMSETPLASGEAGQASWTWHAQTMDLHPSEGEGYWLNLTSETPCLFVMWRMEEGDDVPRPVVVTASYNEAGRMLDAGDRVDRVPMPGAMQAALAEYTMKFYKPEVRKKVKRNDPFRSQGNELIAPAGSPAAAVVASMSLDSRGGTRG